MAAAMFIPNIKTGIGFMGTTTIPLVSNYHMYIDNGLKIFLIMERYHSFSQHYFIESILTRRR